MQSFRSHYAKELQLNNEFRQFVINASLLYGGYNTVAAQLHVSKMYVRNSGKHSSDGYFSVECYLYSLLDASRLTSDECMLTHVRRKLLLRRYLLSYTLKRGFQPYQRHGWNLSRDMACVKLEHVPFLLRGVFNIAFLLQTVRKTLHFVRCMPKAGKRALFYVASHHVVSCKRKDCQLHEILRFLRKRSSVCVGESVKSAE